MNYHILIVEDEATLLRGLLRGLRSIPSFQLTGCSSVEEALVVLEQEVPDLLITDLNLPGLSGLDLVDYLSRHSIRIPVIVMTAYHSNYKEQLSDRVGLTVLEKPIRLADLRHLIERRLTQAAAPSMLGPFQIVDYIQMACLGRHSLRLEISLEGEENGRIEVFEGEIWDAVLGELEPQEALLSLIYNPPVHMNYHTLEEAPKRRRLQRRWDDILLETARLHDEIHSSGTASTDELMGSGSFAFLDAFGQWEEFDGETQAPTEDRETKEVPFSLSPVLPGVPVIDPGELAPQHSTPLREEILSQEESLSSIDYPPGPVLQDVSGLHSPHTSLKEIEMANHNIQECLNELTELDGFVGACLADTSSGMSLGSLGGGEVNLAVAAASNSEVIKAKRKAIKNLRLKETIEDILITLDSQYHIIRPSKLKDELFFYVVLDRQRSNLALARMALNDIESKLRL